jgi:hypothetical protein
VLKSQTVISVPSVVVCRALLEQAGGFDEDLVMCEDFDLWLRLAALSEIDVIDEPLTLVLRHAEHSGNEIVAFEDCRRVIEKMLRANYPARLQPELRRQRAHLAAQIARTHAVHGNRLNALRVLCSSTHYSWRYPQWWSVATQAVARAVLPAAAGALVRAYRARQHVQHPNEA